MSNKLNKNSLSVERGKRLRFVRKITGWTMQAFGKYSGIGRTTINCWEQGINRLTERGAEKIVKALEKQGIYCTSLWLLQGIGETPKIINSEKLSKLHYSSLTPSPEIAQLGEESVHYSESDFETEIKLFKQCYPQHLVYHLKDKVMSPGYQPGDWVGGIILPAQTIDLANGMDCIVHLKESKTLVRRVKIQEDSGNYLFSFYGTNADFSVECPPLLYLKTAQIVSLAPIVRVWRRTFQNHCS